MGRRLLRRGRHVRELAVSFGYAALIEARIRRWTLPQMAQWLGVRIEESAAPATYALPEPRWIHDRMRNVDRVYRIWPWDTCLRRALLLGRRVRAVDPAVRIGVRTNAEGALEAHAWLEIDGISVDPEAANFAPLDRP